VSPQTLVRHLRAQKGALPEAFRRQCVAAGAAVVPALIALLEAGLVDDQAEPEGALFHAVDLLGALGDARVVPILLRCLEHDDLFDGLAPQAAAALRTLGPSALEGCLAAYVTTTNAAVPDRLAGVMSLRHAMSRSKRASGSEGMTFAPRLETITPWLLRIRGIVVVGQPPAGDARRREG
jgi:HEAT repeat protein